MDFNPASPTVMHIDINSCFATIEQQANPFLRGFPIAVAAYDSPSGCILAASVEAKRYGVKTGMRVKDGKALYPALKVIEPDSNKYRFVHRQMKRVLEKFCSQVHPKSIDEFVLDFSGHEVLKHQSIESIAIEIKRKIKSEIGDFITVSVGIATNKQLAKVAAGVIKPDGLVEINKNNFLEIYKNLKLTDLHGINIRNEARLNSVGIYSVIQFYQSPLWQIKAAFKSISAYYWFLRLRGWEADNVEFSRKSFGNSYSIPQNLTTPRELASILAKLVNKTASRLREAGFSAYGVHVGTTLKGGGYIHHGERLAVPIFYTSDIFKKAYSILEMNKPGKPVHTLSVTCYDLVKYSHLQLSVLENVEKKKHVAQAMDKINSRFGSFVVMTGNMLAAGDAVKDRIAFGQGGLSN